MERGIQYLRDLAVLEVIYSDLDNDQLFKDLDEVKCIQPMCCKFVWSAPLSYASSPLSVMTWKDREEQMVDVFTVQLWQCEESLSFQHTEKIKQLSTLHGLSEDPPVVELLKASVPG